MAFSPTYSVGFSVAQDLRSGSLSVTLTNDLAGLGIAEADVEVAFAVTSPAGTMRVSQFGLAGNIHPDVSYTATIPLPLEMDGTKVLAGVYTVSVDVRIVGAVEPGDWRAGPTQTELCVDCIPTLCIEPNVDCLTAIVSARDTTAWEQAGWVIAPGDRTLTLKYPQAFSHVDIVSSQASVSTAGEPIPSRGTWTLLATITATKGALTVTLNYSKEFKGDCDVSLCSLSCLVKKAYEEFYKTRKDTGERQKAYARWQLALDYAGMIANEIRCGADGSAISEYASRLREELGISSLAGCGCDDCDGPMVPLLPTITQLSYIDGDGIDITGDVIALSQWVLDIIASVRSVEIVSTDGSVDVATTNPNPTTDRYDLSVVEPEDSISWKFHWDLRDPLNDSMSSPVVIGTTFQSPTLGYSGPGGIWPRITNFDTVGTTPYRVDVYCVPVPDPLLGPSNALDYSGSMYAEVRNQANNSFTIGLRNGASVLGNIGAEESRATWAVFVSTVDIYIKITKL